MCRRRFLVWLVITTSVACASPTSPDTPAGAVRVTGTVQFQTLEGGFWAVKGDDGIIYDPIGGLPATFQVQNRRITMVARVRNDVGSVHMLGVVVEILSIE